MDRRNFLRNGGITGVGAGLGLAGLGTGLHLLESNHDSDLVVPKFELAVNQSDGMQLLRPTPRERLLIASMSGDDMKANLQRCSSVTITEQTSCVTDLHPIPPTAASMTDGMPALGMVGFSNVFDQHALGVKAPAIDFEVGSWKSHTSQMGNAVPIAKDIGGFIGDYYVRVSWHSHYVGGCIQRNTTHAGLLVNGRDGTRYFDMHIVAWWGGWRPCIALYESYHNWCRTSCTYAVWDAVWSLIYAVATLSLAWWIASAIATFATGACVALLAI